MNLFLLEENQIQENGLVLLRDRQARHLADVIQPEPDDRIRAGIIGGAIGQLKILECANADRDWKVEFTETSEAIPALPCRLLLALPRPKMLKRILQSSAAMGIKEIALINSYRVEKSFWRSPALAPDSIREQLILGLEQGVDTYLPRVTLHPLFKPFVEDELTVWSEGTRRIVCHPDTPIPCPNQLSEPVTLAIGPEGGFIPYEVDKLESVGFQAVNLGPRILRVETAIPFVLGRLFS